MTRYEYIKLIKRIDSLIQRKATGNPTSFGRKLEISDSTLYRHIRTLRQNGAPIIYDKHRGSYTYSKVFSIAH